MPRSSCAGSSRSLTPPARIDPAPHSHLEPVLSAALAQHAGRPALVHGEATLTFAQLGAAADRLAERLAVAPGERVVIVAPNVPALVVAMIASLRAGAVAVPLTARLRRFELQRVIGDAEPAALVSVAAVGGFAVADELRTLAEPMPAVRKGIVVDELGEPTGGWQASGKARSAAEDTFDPAILDEIPAALLYTSGTTGEPKGALVSHGMAVAMARNCAEVLGDEAGSPYGLVVPASHAFGLACLLAGLVAGGAAVLVDATASLEPMVRALERHGARVLHGSPPLFGRLLRTGSRLPLHTGLTAGSLCPPATLEELDRRSMRVLNLYGMTEIGAAVCCRRDDPADIRHRTVGRPLLGYEVRIAPPGAAAGTVVGAAAGEIQVRSPYLPRGYYRRPWTEAEATDGQWFRTGDLGALDADGVLTISGRAKEVVHVGGFNVFPGEVESFLLTSPQIAQAAVIGVEHPVLGEALQAFVVPADGATLEPRDVVRLARGGIAGYKVPYAVEVLDELPLLASGKPDRRQLAAAAADREALTR